MIIGETMQKYIRVTKHCPVCGADMDLVLCPDDIRRPHCPDCNLTYVPVGYADDPDYGKVWVVVDWVNDTTRTHVVGGGQA